MFKGHEEARCEKIGQKTPVHHVYHEGGSYQIHRHGSQIDEIPCHCSPR